MEGWGKIGVQSASVLYPNSCYNESCYIEVQVYEAYKIYNYDDLKVVTFSLRKHDNMLVLTSTKEGKY